MKIFLAQQNYQIGNFEKNTEKIIAAILEAKSQGGDLIVFSELSVCGYPPRDFLYFKDFINKCNDAIEKIKGHADGIAVLVGAPSVNEILTGKDLYNSAYFLVDKTIKAIINKTCLPTYDIFDEDRYFESSQAWNVIEYKGKKLAVTICEDIWNIGANPLYLMTPMDELAKQEPDIMINLSASPFDYTHNADRQSVVRANVEKYGMPMFYCNAIGSQTEVSFDGTSLVFDGEANLVGKLKSFEEDLQGFELNDNGTINAPIITSRNELPQEELNPSHLQADLHIDEVYQALLLGIKDYFKKLGFTKAILGSSGGIDSAVTLALASEALGAENVMAILMPSPYSSGHSVDDAVQLSQNLGNPYQIVPIENVYESFLQSLNPIFKDLPFSVAEENIQSRTRGNILMAIANKFNYILLNTSNKSELATGYGTLYGDMAGGIGVLGDCYKVQVYALAKFINRSTEIIPYNIISKPPSAELRPNQKDSDSLPDYEILDKILYQYVDQSKGPDELKMQGHDNALVDRILKMVNMNEYKRNQFCPIIRISSKAFGVGRRMPIAAKYLS